MKGNVSFELWERAGRRVGWKMESKTAVAFVFHVASSLYDFEDLSETTGAKKCSSPA